MTPYYTDDAVTLYAGDCIETMRTLPDASVDAVVTDPPYGLEFMGKEWDAPWKDSAAKFREPTEADDGFRVTRGSLPDAYRAGAPFQAWCTEWATEAIRVLKPGGHLAAFGGTRTWHRLACAIEDAGFEIRDSLCWMYGSGFPKSLDVSKAIDKRKDWALVERLSDEIKRARADAGLSLSEVGQATLEATSGIYGKWYHRGGHMFFETGRSLPSRPEWECLRHVLPIAPEFVAVYDEAEREVLGETATNRNVGGWAEQSGTGMFQPGERSIQTTAPATDAARQWQGWGTAMKPAHEPIVLARKPLSGTVAATVLEHGTGALNIDGCRVGTEERVNSGMSSLGVMHDDGWKPRDVASAVSGRWPANVILDADAAAMLDAQSGVSGAAPRVGQRTGKESGVLGAFSGQDRVLKCHGDTGGASRFFYTAKADQNERPRVNGVAHPTVKPLDLMRWLVRLVTPPDGVVLEPFAGSGTTAEACVVEGFRCIAIEREPDYLPLIVARLSKPIERTLL